MSSTVERLVCGHTRGMAPCHSNIQPTILPRPLSSASFTDPIPLTAELLAEHGGTLPDGTVLRVLDVLRVVRNGTLRGGLTTPTVEWAIDIGYEIVHVPAASGVGT